MIHHALFTKPLKIFNWPYSTTKYSTHLSRGCHENINCYFLYISRLLSQLTYGWDQSRASRKLPKGRQSWEKSSERQTREVWNTDSHVCTISNMQYALCQWDSSHRPDFHKRHVFCHNSGRVGYKHFTWTQTAVLVFRHRLCASQKRSDVFNATRLTLNSLQLFWLYKQSITNAVHYSLLFL